VQLISGLALLSVVVISHFHFKTPADGRAAGACDIAFHENAGGCQVNFDFVFVFAFAFVSAFLRYTFLPSGEILQSSPERSRARLVLGAAQRTLDGEDGSATLRLGRKVSMLSLQFVSCISTCTL
jgi:hypothetical protein